MLTDYKNLNESQVCSMIAGFYQDSTFAELKRLYLTKSFPEILSVDRREMSHSAFLRWLLDKNESHGLGDFPIKQFLKILVQRDIKQGGWDRHSCDNVGTKLIAVDVMNETVQIDELSFRLERPANTKNEKGRIDILIDGRISMPKDDSGSSVSYKLSIIIENKVYSQESKNQTTKYFQSKENEIKKDKDSALFLFVFLTPLDRQRLDLLSAPDCSCNEFIQINYQDILDSILEPSLERNITDRTKFLINEYIHALGLPALQNNYFNPSTIMATSNKVTEMLTAFLKKNETLLKAALYTRSQQVVDDKESEEIQTAIDLLSVYSNREKDKTHYLFDNKEITGKYALVEAIVTKILSSNKVGISDLSAAFENTIKELAKKEPEKCFETIKSKLGDRMTCPSAEELWKATRFKSAQEQGKKLVYSLDDYSKWKNTEKNNKKKPIHKKVMINDKETYIYNQWGYDSIDYFVYMYVLKKEEWDMGEEVTVIKEAQS